MTIRWDISVYKAKQNGHNSTLCWKIFAFLQDFFKKKNIFADSKNLGSNV